MNLEEVVPWGRTLDEYRGMFDLTPVDLRRRILGCGDGPASFNAELTAQGGQVVSIDPIYAFSGEEIAGRVAETYETIIGQVKQNLHRYVWTRFRDPDDLGRARLAAMQGFLADYPVGQRQGRYRQAELPRLPFADGEFDLALCSHLLFLYSEQLSADFHLASLRELLRVAREVRVFPLLALDCRPSPHLGPVSVQLAAAGFAVEIRPVPYEFQQGGRQMMRITPYAPNDL
jgi:SAM-dependent methyltransferase